MDEHIKQRILIFGGTFNPIHNGHVNLAVTAAQRLDADILLIIPDNIPPHKESNNLVSGEDRLNMCRLAFANFEKAVISDMEITQPGRSYTVNTVQRLREIYPNDELYLLMGTDMFLTFEQWYLYEQIADEVILCAAARDDDQYEQLIAQAEAFDSMGIRSVVVDMEPFEVSSTEIREALQSGDYEACVGLLPDDVLEYIVQRGLYGNAV